MKLYGHLPDPPGMERGLEVTRLVGAATKTLPESHAVPMPDEVLSQNFSNCVNCAFWLAISTAGLVAGRVVNMSVTATYVLALELESPGAKRLVDAGCYPNRAIQAMQQWGIVARTRYADDADPTRPVPPDVLEAGASAKVDGVFRIYETGQARLLRIRQAIAQNHAVAYAQPVTSAYEAMKGGVYNGTNGKPVLGGHYQSIGAYRPGAFLVRGSWGRDFGEAGNVWISESFIASDECSDFTIVTLAPESLR